LEKLRYIHRNSVRRGLCERPEDGREFSFRHYATGAERRVEIVGMDSTKTRTSGGNTLSSLPTAPHKPKPGLNRPPVQSIDVGTILALEVLKMTDTASPEDSHAIPTDASPKEFTMEELERIIPDKHHRAAFHRLIAQLDEDKAALVALKGHLVLEEKITAAIEKFVFHPEYLESARLTFAQKLSIAQSTSLTENDNRMWDLAEKINKLRNTLSHSLEGTFRKDAMNALRSSYSELRGGKLEEWERKDEAMLVLAAVSMCLGFIDAHEQEVERFKGYVNLLDIVVNQHRYARFPATAEKEKPPEATF
jgi:hypothetical protein